MGDERNIDALGMRMVQLGVHLAPPEGVRTPRHSIFLGVADLYQGCPKAQALPVLPDMRRGVELLHCAVDSLARPQEKRRKVAPEGPAAPRPKPIAGPWVSAEDSLQARCLVVESWPKRLESRSSKTRFLFVRYGT